MGYDEDNVFSCCRFAVQYCWHWLFVLGDTLHRRAAGDRELGFWPMSTLDLYFVVVFSQARQRERDISQWMGACWVGLDSWTATAGREEH